MKCLTVPFLLLAGALCAQEPKGITPVPTPGGRPSSATRAVIIGISDYQHNAIPDLKYADRDAEAFAGWLKSPAGGNVPPSNILLLTNSEATAGQAVAALDGLVENSAEGDFVFLYFSGHGDIEKITIRQNGYLLCYDAPAVGYPAGGCLPLSYMQDIISTLSEKKCRVVVVTDACHAGKLAGSTINGAQITNAALTRQFAQEVKIMSCQENEFSLEGSQWGDGHGVFTFYLLNGLGGPADQNADGDVTLRETRRFLEDHVTTDVAPHPQTPVAVGDLNLVLAHGNAAASVEKPGQTTPNFKPTDMRGMLSGDDSLLYHAFEAALDRRDFLSPADDCAEFYFQKLLAEDALRPLHGLLRRNYAAAITDEIQQALNALLDNDPYEGNNWQYHPEKYAQYPAYLQRAIELLGEKHYMYASLMSKKRYFEGYNIAKTLAVHEQHPARRDSLREAAKRLYLEGIQYDPDAAYLYFAIGDMYHGIETYQTDSLVLWCSRAADLSPGWVTPMLRIVDEYASMQVDFNQAEHWVDRALKVLPDSYLTLEKLGYLRGYEGRRDDVLAVAQQMIDKRPELFNAYAILAITHFFIDGDYPATEEYARKSAERNPSPENWALNWWAGSYAYLHPLPEAIDWIKQQMDASTGIQRGYRCAYLVEALTLAGRYEEAEKYGRRLLEEQLAPLSQTNILHMMGKLRARQGRLDEAADFFNQSLASDPTPNPLFVADYAWLGEIARRQNRNANAEAWFNKALAYESNFGEQAAHREETLFLYGNYLLRQNRLTEAGQAFQTALDLRRKGFWGEYGLALLAARKGKQQEALDWLQRALDNYWPDAEAIRQEPLFAKIRKTKRFGTMMAKRFR